MIRNQFHNFLKLQLGGIIQGSQKLREWMGKCKDYEKSNKNRRSREKKKEREKNSKYKVMED